MDDLSREIELADEVLAAINSGELRWEESQCKRKSRSANCYEADWGNGTLRLLNNAQIEVLDFEGDLILTFDGLTELLAHLKQTFRKKDLIKRVPHNGRA